MNDTVSNLLNFAGRVVVVAGAGGGGMGTTITRFLASAGATVVAVDNSQERLDKHIAPLMSQGLSIRPILADVLKDEAIDAVMEAARSAPGDLYGLVTVVGGSDVYWGPSTRVPRASWDRMFALNLDSMFFMTRAVAAELKAQKRPGSLVSISSISGLTANPFQVGYGAAKAAIVSVVQTMALELAADGIRVNTVAPGAIATPAAVAGTNPDLDRKAIPMARRGRAEEIAGTVLFLLSEMAGYITGQCVMVDGGMNLRWTHLDEQNCPAYVRDRAFLELNKA